MKYDELFDDLKNTISVNEVYFQFDEDEPIKIGVFLDGDFSITLKPVEGSNSEIAFGDGKGKNFKLFLKKENELLEDN